MRGKQKLYDQVFNEAIQIKTEKPRPRNFYLPERNDALVHRYYFHGHINRMRFDDLLCQLEREFHLTQTRLTAIINQCLPEITRLIDEKPGVRQLEKKFPWFNWNSKSFQKS